MEHGIEFEWASERAKELLAHLQKLSDDEKVEILSILTNEFCNFCGSSGGWAKCHCLNDE